MIIDIKYCVWDNKTDELKCLDKTALECCEILGITKNKLFVYQTRSKNGQASPYYVIRSDKLESGV